VSRGKLSVPPRKQGRPKTLSVPEETRQVEDLLPNFSEAHSTGTHTKSPHDI